MTEKERMQWLRIALLQIIETHATVGAIRLTLLEQRVLDPNILQVNQAKFDEVWKVARDTVARLGEESGPTLDELLRNFEGPKN